MMPGGEPRDWNCTELADQFRQSVFLKKYAEVIEETELTGEDLLNDFTTASALGYQPNIR